MNDSIIPTNSSDKKENKRWSVSMDIGGLHVSKSVEEIENGFLCTINVYGKKEGSEEYIDKNEKYFSKENPLKDIDIDTKEQDNKDDKLSIDKLFNPTDINNLIK